MDNPTEIHVLDRNNGIVHLELRQRIEGPHLEATGCVTLRQQNPPEAWVYNLGAKTPQGMAEIVRAVRELEQLLATVTEWESRYGRPLLLSWLRARQALGVITTPDQMAMTLNTNSVMILPTRAEAELARMIGSAV